MLGISIMRALLTCEGVGKPLRGGHEEPRFLDEKTVCIFEANCASVKLDRIKPIFMFLEKLADVFASPAFTVTWPFKGDLTLTTQNNLRTTRKPCKQLLRLHLLGELALELVT